MNVYTTDGEAKTPSSLSLRVRRPLGEKGNLPRSHDPRLDCSKIQINLRNVGQSSALSMLLKALLVVIKRTSSKLA